MDNVSEEVGEQINMLSCENKTHLMNGKFLEIFGKKKFTIDLFENEDNLKDLMDMVSLFLMQVAKKEDNLYPPNIDLIHLIIINYY